MSLEKKGTPRVSVVMAVHNAIPFLEEAVESICNQTFRDFEFLIIDDGSTDGSGTWLETRAKKDERLRVFRREHAGLTKSLNFGLEQAQGELIARMDADDVSLSKRFEEQVKGFDEDSELVLLGCEVEFVAEDKTALGARNHPTTHAEIRRYLLSGAGGALTHPVVMFRTQAARNIGGFDESFTTTQDLDFFLRLTDTGKARNLHDTLLLWRQHERSVNRTKWRSWTAMKRKAIANTIERIGVEQYLLELFPDTTRHSFPSSPLALAKRAWSQGRVKDAYSLLRRAIHITGERRESLECFIEWTLIRSWRKIRNGLRKIFPA